MGRDAVPWLCVGAVRCAALRVTRAGTGNKERGARMRGMREGSNLAQQQVSTHSVLGLRQGVVRQRARAGLHSCRGRK